MIRFSKTTGSSTQLNYNKGNITIHTTEKPIFIQSIKDANFIDILACNTNPSYSIYIVKNVKEFINNFSEHNNLVELSSQTIFKFGDCVFDRFHYYGLLGGCYEC